MQSDIEMKSADFIAESADELDRVEDGFEDELYSPWLELNYRSPSRESSPDALDLVHPRVHYLLVTDQLPKHYEGLSLTELLKRYAEDHPTYSGGVELQPDTSHSHRSHLDKPLASPTV